MKGMRHTQRQMLTRASVGTPRCENALTNANARVCTHTRAHAMRTPTDRRNGWHAMAPGACRTTYRSQGLISGVQFVEGHGHVLCHTPTHDSQPPIHPVIPTFKAVIVLSLCCDHSQADREADRPENMSTTTALCRRLRTTTTAKATLGVPRAPSGAARPRGSFGRAPSSPTKQQAAHSPTRPPAGQQPSRGSRRPQETVVRRPTHTCPHVQRAAQSPVKVCMRKK
jgi:hypothetical protein